MEVIPSTLVNEHLARLYVAVIKRKERAAVNQFVNAAVTYLVVFRAFGPCVRVDEDPVHGGVEHV